MTNCPTLRPRRALGPALGPALRPGRGVGGGSLSGGASLHPLAVLLGVLAALADPAGADPTHAWGGAQARALLTLAPCEQPGCLAVVRFDNALTPSAGRGPPVESVTLTLSDLAVLVVVAQGQGTIPDVVQVTPPPGFVAQPRALSVAEDASGTVRVMVAMVG